LPKSQVDPEHAANGKESSIRPMTKETLHGNSPARGREPRAAPFDSAALFMWLAASARDIHFGIDLALFASLSDANRLPNRRAFEDYARAGTAADSFNA